MKNEIGENEKINIYQQSFDFRYTKIFLFLIKSKQNLYIFHIISQKQSVNNFS